MAGTLINDTLKGINQGVSQQYTETRRETQVAEMINCTPSISRGVLRRNPTVSIGSLAGYVTDVRPFVYSYDRGTGDEQYMIIIGNGSYVVYNVSTGVIMDSAINVPYLTLPVGSIPSQCFSATTIVDNTFIINKTKTVLMKTGTGDEDGVTDSHKKTGVYWIKRTSQVATHQETVSAATGTRQEGYIYSLTSDGIIAEIQAYKDTRPTSGDGLVGTLQGDQIAQRMACLLNGNTWDGINDKCTGGFGDYELDTTVGNETYYTRYAVQPYYKLYYKGELITSSNTKIVFPYLATAGTYNGNIFITSDEDPWVGQFVSIAIDIGGADKGYRPSGPYVYRKDNLSTIDSWDWSDSFGNEASFGFHGETRSTDLLPDKMPADLGRANGVEGTGTIVRVTGITADTIDDYWMEYTGDTWVETREPGLYNTIDEATMPHVFRRETLTTFSFGYYGENAGGVSLWEKRMVGDESTAQAPSFVNNEINDIFFHKNRLGLMTNDAIVLSELSAYGNFFPNSVRYLPDDDMIDLVVATTDITNLRSAVSTSSSLMLFSDDSQFTLSSVDGALTPSTATIEAASRYNYSDHCPAIALGNQVFFMSQSGSYDQLFSYRLTEGGTLPTRADQLSAHVPSYIPQESYYITGHSVLGTVFILPSDGSNTVYVYNHLENNGELVQSAFHKWEFHKSIIGIQVINNEVYLVNSDYGIGKVSLEVPGDITTITYRDATQDYESSILFSRFHVRDGDGIGTQRGRLQLRTLLYSINPNSHWTTSITNTELTEQVDPLDTWILSNGSWDDTGIWDDTKYWLDGLPYFIRTYKDDDKITVMGNADNTAILFSTNTDYPTAGFELNTLNYEAFFNQRSRRI